MPTALLVCSNLLLSAGCGSSASGGLNRAANSAQGALQLSPAMASLSPGESVRITPMRDGIAVPLSHCVWEATDNSVPSSNDNGEFVGSGVGSSPVTATCGGDVTSASALVSPTANPSAIRITSGGTYGGNWSSADPKVPAVTILTNDPVILRNATITGRGDLIVVYGRNGGANVTIDNVTGIALDPGVTGQGRGTFLGAERISHLSVTHCTMRGVSFGVYIVSSTLASLQIRDNVARDLEDRKSDGHGGFLLNQRLPGHLIQLNNVSLPNGGEIAWNQMINSDGASSVEDIINFYESRGSAGKPVRIHDNYLEGGFSAGLTTSYYTGAGIQLDGESNDPSKANGFVMIANNTLVHLAGDGISIAAGHDIYVIGNRIVSCGKDSSGRWIANPGSNALGMWNYYKTNQYFNNYIANNSGGLVKPDANGNPSPGNIYAPSASGSLNNVVNTNAFEQPCLVGSHLNLAAESIERNRWLSTVAEAGELLGDQH
ncbi:hypothetical protein [Edaphobacter aggregans]|uniref:hypothetical protein n=1 Tax=Edaphobacter aggregans TaxID=570835 RepID=UPI0012FB4199|nr:hypothetical protein [Edaphobacter aggregans]